MSQSETTTLENILKAAKTEFLSKGFMAASLRNIVKCANVTTGAFYGYYSSKEALFDALVKKQADYFLDEYKKVQQEFKLLSPQKQENSMGKDSQDWMIWILSYIYDNFDAFKLLLTASEGTKYEHFIHTIVEIEIEATEEFLNVLEKNGKNVHRVDKELEHILISGMFSGFFEIIIHDMPIEKAKQYIKVMSAFQTAGWKKIMGL